jgi:hypothetical protein
MHQHPSAAFWQKTVRIEWAKIARLLMMAVRLDPRFTSMRNSSYGTPNIITNSITME